MKFSSALLAATTILSTVVADTYIISFRNLDTPDMYYNKVKSDITGKFEGKIITEYSIIKGFTAEIPNTSIFTLQKTLHDPKYPINIEKDSSVTIAA